jgi:hypothetical protein
LGSRHFPTLSGPSGARASRVTPSPSPPPPELPPPREPFAEADLTAPLLTPVAELGLRAPPPAEPLGAAHASAIKVTMIAGASLRIKISPSS